jgi:hypothetical protein
MRRRSRTSRRHITLTLSMLVLALLALLTPLIPSLSQLSSSSMLVRALPEENETSTRMEAEVNGALHVYRDGSASLALHISRRFDKPIPLRFSFNASLNVDESTSLLNASLEQTVEPLALPSFNHGQELFFERKLQADLGNTTTISLEERTWDEESEVSLFIFITDKRAVELNAVWEGHLRMRATGVFSTLIEEVNVTDEELLKEMVASLFKSYLTEWGGTVVNVAVLNATKTEDELVMNFCASINKEKVVEKLRGLFNIDVTATFFDEMFSPPSSSIPITFTLSTFQNTTIYKLEGSLVALREDFWKAAFFAYTIYDIFGQYHIMRPIYATNLQPIFYALPLLAHDFEVMKGGRLRLSIKEVEGADALMSSLSIDIITPRVVKKGPQGSMPVNTLRALSNYTLTFYDTFFYWVRGPDVSSIALEVFSEEDVKVRLGDSEVKEVVFKDVSSLKVTFVTTLTVSVEPSTIEVGREVVIKGRIEPAMSVSITISVRGPDGSLKTIDATTGGDGSFSVPIRLEKAGSYTIIASYTSNDLYEPSIASTVVEVGAPPAPPLSPSAIPEALWYVIAIVVVVVGIVIAVIKAPWSARRP